MAAPKRNSTKPDDPRQRKTREAIRTTQLVNRLQQFALGEKDPANGNVVELEAGRLKAIEILLRKALPDLSTVTLVGDNDADPINTKETGQGTAKLAAVIERIAERNQGQSEE